MPYDLDSPAAVRRFAVQLSVLLIVVATVSVLALFVRTQRLAEENAREQAASYVDLVVTGREWNAQHGGVWVPKDADTSTNPFLEQLGVEADTSTVSGAPLTLRNPAAMTREISDLTLEEQNVSFRLVSVDPVNPANRADAWEVKQLTGASDIRDVSRVENTDSGRFLRLIRPLAVEPECLGCHGAQGYEVGDIRGAISVRIPLEERDRGVTQTAIVLAALWLGLLALTGGLVYRFVLGLTRRLETTEMELRRAAATDSLTGLPNRRATMERLSSELARARREGGSVGVIMIDIDRFKSLNDTHGHQAGDAGLAVTAGRISETIREYDLAGRIGGEEFLIIAPGTASDELAALAERVRRAVDGGPISLPEGKAFYLTVSAGYALWNNDRDEREDALLRRADDALYAAKSSGRNRTQAG